jgi:mono/diheme cytochrome c family protein
MRRYVALAALGTLAWFGCASTPESSGGRRPVNTRPVSPNPPAASPRPSPESSAAGPWEPPPEDKARPNPVAPSPEAFRRGRFLYNKYCTACHGPEGRGDGPASAYWAHMPKDLTDPDRQNRLTDGEIFWKITNGHRSGGDVIMPGFRNSMPSDEDRWKVVLYVRSLGARR